MDIKSLDKMAWVNEVFLDLLRQFKILQKGNYTKEEAVNIVFHEHNVVDIHDIGKDPILDEVVEIQNLIVNSV